MTFASSVSPFLSETETIAFLDSTIAMMLFNTRPVGTIGARHAKLQPLQLTCTCASCCCRAHPAANPVPYSFSGTLSAQRASKQ